MTDLTAPVKSVLMAGPSLSSQGGMATIENSIVESLNASGVNVHFVPTYVEGGKPKKLAAALRGYAEFNSSLNNVDLVHIHSASRGSFVRKSFFIDAAFKHNIPIVLHIHSGEFLVWYENECDGKQRARIRRTFEKACRVVLLSKEWRDGFVEKGICSSEKIEILHNAVNTPLRPVDIRMRQDVLFLGRLGACKSPDVLLRAAKTVLKSHPQVCFRFGGDGDVAKYRALAEELGIAANCDFLGWTTGEQKEEAIRASCIYCLPSKHEGMPMSVLEAMSYGLATIATPVGGVPQVIQDGVNGFLMPVDDSGLLASRINELLDDSDLATRIGLAGRKTIEESFGMDSYAKQLVDIYEEITGQA